MKARHFVIEKKASRRLIMREYTTNQRAISAANKKGGEENPAIKILAIYNDGPVTDKMVALQVRSLLTTGKLT